MLERYGMTATVTHNPRPGTPVDAVAAANLAALDALSTRPQGSFRLAIKLSTLQFDGELVRALEERASETGVTLHFDALAHETATKTYELAALVSGAPIGLALPGRWRRSIQDAGVAAERGHSVRVVKGQFPDPADPEPELRRRFVDLVAALAGTGVHVLVATHEVSLADESLRCLLEAGSSCELELILGMPLAGPVRVARALGVPVRIYVAYGEPWLPYAIRKTEHRRRHVRQATQDVLLGTRKVRRDLARTGMTFSPS